MKNEKDESGTATAKTKSAGKGRVFSVSSAKGPLETVFRAVAVEDATKAGYMNEETCDKMLSDGSVIFSDDFYYSESAEALAKYTIESEPEPVESEAVRAGDTVVHLKSGKFGDVVLEDGKLYVKWQGSLGKNLVNRKDLLSNKWRKATASEFFDHIQDANVNNTAAQPEPEEAIAEMMEQAEESVAKPESQALAVVEPAIEGEAIIEMTAKEMKRLNKLESDYEKIDELEKHIPFEKGKILNEIRQDKLYRATHRTFGEYALARFGITRSYAQILAQTAGIPELLAEAVETGTEFNISVKAASALMADANKIADRLGVGKMEFDAIKPILQNTLAVMASVAPKNDKGEIEITQKFVASFNETIASHLTDGVVTIGGKQMTVEAAGEKGLLNHSLRAEVLETAAEQIKSNAEKIRSEIKKKKERQQTPINGAGVSSATDVYKGQIPKLEVVCSVHSDTEILEIGTGKLLCRCGCRFHIDNESGELTAFECDDKRIVR